MGSWLSLLVLLALVSGVVSVFHGADAMWDVPNYHLYNPFESHHDRYSWDVAPAQLQSYLNPFLDYPFYVLVRLFNDHPRVIAFCMGLPQGVNLWLIGLLAWQFSTGGTRITRYLLTGLSILIGGTGAGTLPLVGSTTGDVFVTVPVLASLLFALRGIDRIRRSRADAPDRTGGLPARLDASRHLDVGGSAAWDAGTALRDRTTSPHLSLLLAGFLSGAAVGAKPTTACYAVGLLAALLAAVPPRILLGSVLRFGGAAALGVSATGGYHAARMFRLFDSPLFPLYNNVFRSPFWKPDASRDIRFLPSSALDILTFPFRWATDATHPIVSELPFRDIRVALSLGLIAVAASLAVYAAAARAAVSRSPSRTATALFVFVVVSYGLWAVEFAIYRYLIPLEMLSGVIAIATLTSLVRPSVIPPLLAAVAAACWATTVPLEWGHAPFTARYVEIDAPALPPNALVLIVGDKPISFLVPFMDPSARWLSLDNNFINPNQDNLLVKREREIIAHHDGAAFALMDVGDQRHAAATLSQFGATFEPGSCDKVRANIIGYSYRICPVRLAAR